MTQRNGRVFSVMQELRQLRDKVCVLSENNRTLAKALTTTKQELTKARAAQTNVFSNQVVEWMEARHKLTEVRHQAVQCSIEELSQDTKAPVEDTAFEVEPDPPFSPPRNIAPPTFTPQVPSPVAPTLYKRAPTTFTCNKRINSIEELASTAEGDNTEQIVTGTVSTDSSQSDHQYTGSALVVSSSERAGSQAGVKRLRQRNTSLSYVEPKLNTKLRRGDDYGLGKRTGQQTRRSPKPRVISGPRRAKSPIVPSRFGLCSPFRGRRTTRPVQRISYVEPKLNTKLRKGDKFTFTT